jgi:hypothetical protein
MHTALPVASIPAANVTMRALSAGMVEHARDCIVTGDSKSPTDFDPVTRSEANPGRAPRLKNLRYNPPRSYPVILIILIERRSENAAVVIWLSASGVSTSQKFACARGI